MALGARPAPRPRTGRPCGGGPGRRGARPGGTALEHYSRALELDALGRAAVAGPLPSEPGAAKGERRLDRPELLARAAEAAFVDGTFRRAAALAARAIDAQVDITALSDVVALGRDARERRALELGSLYERLGRYRWAAGEIDGALSAFVAGAQCVPPASSLERARVLGALAQALMLEGRFEESARWARDAIAAARGTGPAALADLGHATCTLGVDAAYLGDLEGGLAMLGDAAAIARQAGRLDDLMRSYANQTTLLELDSRRTEALAIVDEGIAEARRWGQEAVYGAFLRGNGADTLFVLGRWAEAEAMCHQALEWSPSGVARFNPLVWLTNVRVESASDEEAGRLLGQLLLQQEAVPDSQWVAEVERATVSFALWREDVQDARRAAERGWARVIRTDDWAQVAISASTTLEAAAAVAEDARDRRDAGTVADAVAWADVVLAEARRRVDAGGMSLELGGRIEAELHLATARAHRTRVVGEPDPATWADLAQRWAAVPNPYRAAHARWREAEAVLRSRPDTPRGRVNRAHAREALLQSWQIARALGAAPLCRELVRLAARARIPLPEASGPCPGSHRRFQCRRSWLPGPRNDGPRSRAPPGRHARVSARRSLQPQPEGEGGARRVGRGALKPRDRPATLHQRTNSRSSRRQHTGEARRRGPRRGGDRGAATRTCGRAAANRSPPLTASPVPFAASDAAFGENGAMDNRARSLVAFATVTILAWFVLAACASSAGPGRTYVPPAATPQSSGAPAGGGISNEIDLVETASLQITNPAGQPVTTITVRRGQTYHFKITNTAGFVHNFYIGKVSDLEADNLAKLTGVGDFSSGTKEFDYTFSDTSAPLGFGCMVPGHYQAGMKGTFTVQ